MSASVRRVVTSLAALTLAVPWLGFATTASAADPTAFVLLDSEPGDWVGQGAVRVYTSPSVTIAATGSALVAVGAVAGSGGPSEGFLIQLDGGNDLTVRAYESAQRFPYAVGSGLSVVGGARGCGTLSGTFEVLDLERDAEGTPTAFAASFVQFCEMDRPALYGEIRYNSSLPVTAVATTPAALSFGVSRSPENVTITNIGTASSPLSVQLVGRDPGEFMITTSSCGPTLAVAAHCDVSIAPRPIIAGGRSAELLILDGTARGRRSVPLDALGPAAPSLTITASTSTPVTGMPVTFTVVAPEIGGTTIDLLDGSNRIDSIVLDSAGTGATTAVLAPGTHWVAASSAGTTTATAASSAPIRIVASP